MQQTDYIRSQNRALINGLFNGDPPLTQAEADANKVAVNINWREACVLGHQARRQYEQAFLSPTNFFSVDVENAPITKRSDWSNFITTKINRCMKKSMPYIQLVRSKFAGIVLHGVGAQYWENQDSCWRPKFIAIEDLMVPTDTNEDLENLPYFAIRRIYTPGELFRKISGVNVDPGWNKKVVYKILDSMKNVNIETQAYDWLNQPEKMAELWKQNQCYYESDGAPSVTLWEFFHLEEEADKPGWRKKMMLDKNGPSLVENEFVYDSDRVLATELSQILHINFGDLSNKPPFKYHSVRSLGFLLYDVCHMMNRLRCQWTQRVFEDLLTWYRVNDPSDKGRLNSVALSDKGIIPDGLSIIKRDERYQPDINFVNSLTANFRQLMSEASSTFTQDIDNGTTREITATETMARVNQVNALLSSLLNLAYVQETFNYIEICRRFCNPKCDDPQVKRFQILAKAHGIPARYLNHENWNIQPETTLGSGNKILQVAQAKALMEIRPQLDPNGQTIVTHLYAEAVADAKTAEMIKPLGGGPKVTDATHDAELSFGAMMAGTPVRPVEGTSHIEQIETMLRLMAMKIQGIQQTDNVGTPSDVIGFQIVALNINGQIQMLAQDDSMKERCRQYSDALNQMMNEVKGFAQRQEEMARKAAEQNGQGQIDPETIAKIQSDQMLTQSKVQQGRIKAMSDVQNKRMKTQAEVQALAMKTQGEIRDGARKTKAEIQMDQAMTAQELHDMALLSAHQAATATNGDDGKE